MSRKFNPSIRKLTRLSLEIPPDVPLMDCSWPKDPTTCRVKDSTQLIESKLTTAMVEQYELRSIDEREQCMLGPEALTVLQNPLQRKTIFERLVDLEVQAGNLPEDQRTTLLQNLESDVHDELKRRSRMIFMYIIYFTIGLLFLSYQYQRSRSASLVLTNVIPLITIYFLHNLFAERVLDSGFVHLIPILLLVSYGLHTWTLQPGQETSLPQRTLLWVVILATLLISIKLLFSFRDVYTTCLNEQRGTQISGLRFMMTGILGLILPLVIVFAFHTL